MNYRILFLATVLAAILPCLSNCEEVAARQQQPGQISPSNATERWLDTVIIPEVEFRAAHILDCLDFIANAVNKSATRGDRDPIRVLFDSEAMRDTLADPLLPTFTARDISAFRVLKILEALGNLRIGARPDEIVVERKKRSADKVPQVTAPNVAEPER